MTPEEYAVRATSFDSMRDLSRVLVDGKPVTPWCHPDLASGALDRIQASLAAAYRAGARSVENVAGTPIETRLKLLEIVLAEHVGVVRYIHEPDAHTYNRALQRVALAAAGDGVLA
jgi:hypothetical protein